MEDYESIVDVHNIIWYNKFMAVSEELRATKKKLEESKILVKERNNEIQELAQDSADSVYFRDEKIKMLQIVIRNLKRKIKE